MMKTFMLINYSLLCKVIVYNWAKQLRVIEKLMRKKKYRVIKRLNWFFLEANLTLQGVVVPDYFFSRIQSLQNPSYYIVSILSSIQPQPLLTHYTDICYKTHQKQYSSQLYSK